MDVLIITSLIVVFALPGILFNRYLATGRFKSYIAHRHIVIELAYGIFWAIIVHTVIIGIIYVINLVLNLKILEYFSIKFLLNTIIFHTKDSMECIKETPGVLYYPLIVYLAFSNFFAITTGLKIHDFIFKNLEPKNRFYRRKSFIFYYLRGMNEKFSKDSIGVVFYAASTVNFNGDTFIYRGLIDEWDVNKNDGSLKYLVLRHVKYRHLNQHEEYEKRYFDLKSDIIILPAQNIATLTVEYFEIFRPNPSTNIEDINYNRDNIDNDTNIEPIMSSSSL